MTERQRMTSCQQRQEEATRCSRFIRRGIKLQCLLTTAVVRIVFVVTSYELQDRCSVGGPADVLDAVDSAPSGPLPWAGTQYPSSRSLSVLRWSSLTVVHIQSVCLLGPYLGEFDLTT
jgi:hypothetical protein